MNKKKSPGIVKYQQIDGIFYSFFFFFPLDCEWLVYIHILMSFGNCGTYFSAISVSFSADSRTVISRDF